MYALFETYLLIQFSFKVHLKKMHWEGFWAAGEISLLICRVYFAEIHFKKEYYYWLPLLPPHLKDYT